MKRLLFLIYTALISFGCNNVDKAGENQSNSENSSKVADARPDNVEYEATADLSISQLLNLRRMTTKEIDAYLTARSWLYQGEQKDTKNYGNQVIWYYSTQKANDDEIKAAYIIHTINKKIISNDYIFNNSELYQLFLTKLNQMGLKKGRTLSDDGIMTEYIGEDALFQLNKNNPSENPKFALMIRPLE